MSFIAGYLSRQGKSESCLLEEKVKAYPTLAGEDPESYENLIMQTKFGYIIQKCKKNYPIQSQPCEDVNGNLLIQLGFHYASNPINDNQNLLELCVRNSPEVLEGVEGEFVFVFSEGHSGNVHIVNDRFASRPFYILQDHGHIFFSSNLDFLLYLHGGKHAIDILGWFQIFSYGHTCGTRTTIGDIRRLKPGTHLTLSPDGILEKQYWSLRHEPETGLDPIAHSSKVFEAFQAGTAMRAKLVGKGVVALSGGLDSRLVAGVLPKGVDYSAFTFVDSTETSRTDETNAAAEVCEVLGLNHRIQEIRQDEFSRVANQVIRLTGGLRPLHHTANAMLYIKEIKRQGLNFLLGGGPGDIIAGSKVPSGKYLDPDRVAEVIIDFCRSRVAHSDDLALLFHEDIVKQYSRDIYSSLFDSFENITGPTAAHRVTAWALMHRWPAFTFTSVIHNHPDVAEAFCHLDYKFCDLMLKLPADWLFGRSFYAFMIYNSLPQLRHIIYSNTGKPLSSELKHVDYRESLARRTMGFVTDVGREFVHRSPISQKLVRLIRPRTTPRASPSFNYCLLRNDKMLLTEIVDCLYSYASLKEVLDTRKCIAFLNNFRAGNFQGQSYSQQSELVGSLATMCLSFRYLNL